MFVKENINPKGKKVADCVIRAIAKAEGKDWLEIFDILTEIARQNYSVLNDKTVYGKYLDKYPKVDVMHYVDGYSCVVKNGVRTESNKKKKRYTVEEICEWKGTYIVSIAGHLTCVIEGVIYDTWDCSDSSSYVIWKVK